MSKTWEPRAIEHSTVRANSAYMSGMLILGGIIFVLVAAFAATVKFVVDGVEFVDDGDLITWAEGSAAVLERLGTLDEALTDFATIWSLVSTGLQWAFGIGCVVFLLYIWSKRKKLF